MAKIEQQEFAEITPDSLKESYPNLSEEDINFIAAKEKILTDSGIIGIHKYNYLVEKDRRNKLFNFANPDKEPLLLSELEKKQIVLFETEKLSRDKESQELERQYLVNLRSDKPKIHETIPGTPLDKTNLYKGFKQVFRLLENKDFIETPDTISNLEVIVKYFAKDNTFFNCRSLIKKMKGSDNFFDLDPSFDKGILIVGDYGNGKTTIMKCFEYLINHNLKIAYEKKWDNIQDWQQARFQIANCHDIVSEYEALTTQDEKDVLIKKYKTFRFSFDDLKKEQISNNYGKKNIIQTILEKRYDNKSKTFGTCNYKENFSGNLAMALLEFGDKYGGHIYDRIFKMCNIVEFKGKSFRK